MGNKKKRRKTAGFTAVLILALIVICVRFIAVPKILYPLKYEAYVEKYSSMYGLEEELIYAVIKTESGFRENAVSHKGAIGLMQIMESTADWIVEGAGIDVEKEDYWEPEINIQMGCWYLNYLKNVFKKEDLVLAAYNAGMGNVMNWLKDENYSADGFTLDEIPFKETKEYVRRVEMAKKAYKRLYFED